MSAIVHISSVSKSFQAPDGRLVQALKEVSLDIPAGKFTTLLGPSGCGKTTLLRLIGGFEEPSAGGVFIDGVLMEGVPANKRPTNTVFQHYGLFPHMTVAANVAYGLEVARQPKAEVAKRVEEALELVRLSGMGSRKVAQLSGGQQQRVALARAIVLRPKVLLLDEPMAALDRKLRKEMQVELKRLQHELDIAFLCVTHDQEEALSMSDLVVVMNQGHIEQMGAPLEIYDRPLTKFVAGFVGEASLFNARIETREPGLTHLRSAGGTLLVVAADCPDGDVDLCIRPEKFHKPEGDDPRPRLSGRVVESIYLGSSTRLELELPGGERLVGNLSGTTPPADGEMVTVCYSPEDFRLLQA